MKTIWMVLLTCAAAAGCDLDDPCDKGQRYAGGLCYVVGADAAPVPDAEPRPDTDPGTEAGDAGGEDAQPFAHYGDLCTADADCTPPTDICAILPGEAEGYCTRTGCVEEPSICPEGWSCLDLSQIDPTYPSVCILP